MHQAVAMRRARGIRRTAGDGGLPAIPANAVVRPRLLSLLEPAVRDQRLTLIVAPAGYGKSVVLSQLAASGPGERVRWLTLGKEHNSNRGLAKALCEVLGDPGRGSLPPPTPMASAQGGASLGVRFLSALVEQLAAMPPTTFVLDDLHMVSSPALLDDIAAVIEHAPRTFHVVVATQLDPPAGFYRLGLAEMMLELRQEDLAFNLAEAWELLASVSGRRLARSNAEALLAKTEGWAAGLQLAAVALRGEDDVDGFVERFAREPRHVADYLAEHVLDRQPVRIREFLLTTSILERMNGSLCDALTGRDDGALILEHLERNSLFVSRTGPDRRWYRYHALFRGLLRSHLHVTDPAGETALLHRAACWHRAHDDIDQAVAGLIDAGAWDEVVESAFDAGPRLLLEARTQVLIDWLQQIPADRLAGRSDVLLLRMAAVIFGGRPVQVAEALAEVAATVDVTRGARLGSDVLRAYWSVLQARPDEALEVTRSLLVSLDGVADHELVDVLGLTGTRSDLVAAVRGVRGFAFLQKGDLRAAHLELGPREMELYHPLWQSTLLGTRALVEAVSGRLAQAEQAAREVLGVTSEVGLRQPATKARLALASVLSQRGDLDAAADVLGEAQASIEPARQRASAGLLAVQWAALDLARGEPSAALASLNARRSKEDPPLPVWIVAQRISVEARAHLALGDLDAAEQALDAETEAEDPDLLAARARLEIARGDLSRARDALTRMEGERPRSRRALASLGAVIAHRTGEEQRAMSRLAGAVVDAEEEWDVGVLLSGGPSVLELIKVLYLMAPSPFLRSVLDHSTAESAAHRPVQGLVEQITEREYALLRVLPTRLSNAEIAARFGISNNTVKTHLKHIYRKLDVDSRSDAVAVAERLGLM